MKVYILGVSFSFSILDCELNGKCAQNMSNQSPIKQIISKLQSRLLEFSL